MDTEIAARGIDDVKLSDVAAAAACTVGALPHYFENKDAILLGALRHVHAAMLARGTVTAITSDLDPVETWLSALPADPEGRDEWLVWLAFTGRAPYADDLAHEFRENSSPTRGRPTGSVVRSRTISPCSATQERPSHEQRHRLHRRDRRHPGRTRKP